MVANGVVYIGGNDGFLYAYGATNGNPPVGWPQVIGDDLRSSPAVANGVVYVAVTIKM